MTLEPLEETAVEPEEEGYRSRGRDLVGRHVAGEELSAAELEALDRYVRFRTLEELEHICAVLGGEVDEDEAAGT